ncbi:hypothetical protein EB796_001948 [Bugula neritina]|uniref:Transferrin receptor-like dimerisation domain-containing protein n=1 Tax=Bugula neritina TaxID=10212 RepID=A0A7J7KNN1_BUGNE|nr:hypothetical protein EB796_001948 [Bugula neritina]
MIPFVTSDYGTRLKQVFKALDDRVRPTLAGHGDGSLTKSLDYLSAAINKFAVEAAKFDEEVRKLPDSGAEWTTIRKFNDQLFLLERSFLYPLGILDRKYIRHVVFAPSATDSYASAAFPGISDALYKIAEDDEAAWERVKVELSKSVYIIESATKTITVDYII